MLDSKLITDYLAHFGYKNDLSGVQAAQGVLGIETDKIATMEKAIITTPRCGHFDCASRSEANLNPGTMNLEQPFGAASQPRNQWDRQKALGGLKIFIERGVDGMAINTQKDLMVKGFSVWEQYSQLEIWIVNNQSDADIIVSASASRAEQFGQVGNVLAWAQLPQGPNWGLNGQKNLMKYDLSETWTMDMFLATTSHEAGHLWGLDHTQMAGQLMLPVLDLRIITPQHGYDIEEVILRYGQRSSPPPTPSVPTANPFNNCFFTDDKGRKYKLIPA